MSAIPTLISGRIVSVEEPVVQMFARATVSTTYHLMLRRVVVVFLALILMLGAISPIAYAAPTHTAQADNLAAQNVDWMSPETAAALDIGMDVLVPSWIPGPFTGMAPSVTAGGGYYQLYWMISGGSPTFLYIEGTVGGALPAGSPADLNKPLSINSSVQGWDAIHDVGTPAGSDTPIYDQVWWIANGVLYTVSSNNMMGTDTVSLANSLLSLQPPPPAEEAPAPTDPPYVPPTEPPYVPPTETEPVYEEPVTEVPEEPVTEVPEEAVTEVPEEAAPVEQEPADVVVTTEPRNVDSDTVSRPRTTTTGEPADTESGTSPQTTQRASDGQSWSPDRFEGNIPSDGTNGPRPPVLGGDGTGGLYDTSLPNIRVRP